MTAATTVVGRDEEGAREVLQGEINRVETT